MSFSTPMVAPYMWYLKATSEMLQPLGQVEPSCASEKRSFMARGLTSAK